jgi:HSP20 family molecular chaperone IbpA
LGDLNYIEAKGKSAMASKALRLIKGVPKAAFTIEQLFEAAFGPEPLEYHFKSLLGWRPLSLATRSSSHWVENAVSADRPATLDPPAGVKVYETEALIVVEVELPAIDEDSLYLEISGYMLIIRGNPLPPDNSSHRLAARYNDKKVHRCIQLPILAKPGEVRARLEGNIVRVMIRKRLQAD